MLTKFNFTAFRRLGFQIGVGHSVCRSQMRCPGEDQGSQSGFDGVYMDSLGLKERFVFFVSFAVVIVENKIFL